MEDKIDRRIKYTKMVLKQSLLELMKTEPISKITVTDICRGADVNRNTFYTHYSSPFDLLSQIQDELFLKISQSIERLAGTKSAKETITEICRAIADNGELSKVVISDRSDQSFLKRILNTAREESLAEWEKHNIKASRAELEMMYLFTASGSIAVIEEWLRGGMKETPEQIAQFIDNITNLGQAAFLRA